MLHRALYRCYRLFSSVRYWVGRRFRPAGLVALAGLVVAAGMGLDTSQNVAHQAFAFLLALLLVAMGFALRFRARFAGERLLPRFATVGSGLAYRVLLHNHTDRAQRGLLLIENLADPRPSQADFVAQFKADDARTKSLRLARRRPRRPRVAVRMKAQPVPAMPPRGSAEVTMQLTPLRRGVARFTALTVARPDPLGMFQAFVHVPKAQSLVVLPRRYALPAIALPGAMKYQQGGVAQASSVGESEEFVALRDYRPGDPPRRIHWPSWAKLGAPVVKEFQDEFFVRHALVLDTFTSAPESEVFEEAVSVAASFACTVRTQESLLDLMFIGPRAVCLTAGRGLAHVEQMLEVLAAVRPCRDQPFAALSRLVLEHAGVVSGCIVILLEWDEPRRELLERLEALGIPALALLVVEAGGGANGAAAAPDRPACLRVLEAGRIEADLAKLRTDA
jgi:uncharacterized protein (DUF58 family)